MDDKTLLEAIRAIVQEENKPITERLDNIEQQLSRVAVTQENRVLPKLDLISEGVEGITARLDKQDKLETERENHDHRLWALEQAVRAK